MLSSRVNVLLATPEVLSAVPGIEASLAQAIVQKRGEIQGSPEDQRSVGWLLGHQLVDLSTMERLAPYLTMGGNVYSGQVIGFRDDYSAFYRCTAILSAVGQPKALQIERWHAWGRGFQSIELRQGQHLRTHWKRHRTVKFKVDFPTINSNQVKVDLKGRLVFVHWDRKSLSYLVVQKNRQALRVTS